MKPVTLMLPALLAALLFCQELTSDEVKTVNQDSTPVWAEVPDTISPEWGRFLAKKGLNRDGRFPAADDIETWKNLQKKSNQAKEAVADKKAEKYGAKYQHMTLAGVPVIEVNPSKLTRRDKIAVYTHGGAYVVNSAKATVEAAMMFAAETGLRVISVDYTLAPHSKWQQTTDDVVSVFKALAEEGFTADDIVLFGDSAGAGLAAASTLKMRDLDMSMPAALVLWSPWVDISETGDTYITLRNAEAFYTYEGILGPAAYAYADAKDHKNPYVSPVYGDFTKGFPPTLIQGGTRELLLSNFIRLYQGLDQAGQTVKLDIYEGMPHVFQLILPDSVESRTAMTKVGHWVSDYLLNE